MAYKITYGKPCSYMKNKKKARGWIWILLLLPVLWGFLDRDLFVRLKNTYNVEIITEELRQGHSMEEAMTAFCLHALHQADVR